MNLGGIALSLLGLIVTLAFGLMTLLNRQRPRKILFGSIAALLAVVSVVGLLTSLDILFRATAPVSDNLNLYSIDNSGRLVALKAKDATIRWQVSFVGGAAPPFVAGDVLYTETNSGTYAVRASDGRQIWHSTTAIKPGALTNDVVIGITQRNSTNGSTFAALRTSDGSLAWTSSATTFDDLVLQDTVVYGGTTDGLVYALQVSNGQVLWQHSLASGQHDPNLDEISSLATDDGKVFGIIGIQNNLRLFAIDQLTQRVDWQNTLPQSAWAIGGIATAPGVFYLGTGSDVEAFNTSDGTLLWKYAFAGNQSTSPFVLFNNILYFGSGGAMYALKAHDGSVQWIHHDSTDTFFAAVNVYQNIVFARSECVGPHELPTIQQCNFWFAFRASDGLEYYRHNA